MELGIFIKKVFWKTFGPSLTSLIARFAHDTRFSSDPNFSEFWDKNQLVLVSLRQDYDPQTLESTAQFIAYHSLRKELFSFWQQHGFIVYPQSYLSPFPDRNELLDNLWQECYSTTGINLNVDRQKKMLEDVFCQYKSEFSRLSGGLYELPAWDPENPYFSGTDAKVLYSFIRQFQPAKVIEIGSGYSTFIIWLAAQQNYIRGVQTSITTIDPEPRADITQLGDGIINIQQPVQTVNLDLFKSLQVGDVLFIDSSHVVRIGGDTIQEILKIVPSLNPGVLIHFHDIFCHANTLNNGCWTKIVFGPSSTSYKLF